MTNLEPTAEQFAALAARPPDGHVLVQYPTPKAFIDMVTTEGYAKVREHRTAALDRGDLIATSQWFTLQ
ncbi:MAG TPA: hypothetical protein VGC05_06850 [Mycobacterium sp.]